jgi:hypothetical protein
MKNKITPENNFLKGIYQIKNLITNDVYIGSTNQYFKARYSKHISSYKNFKLGRKKIHPILFNAFDKYHIDNFEFSVIEIINDLDKIRNKEEYYIKLLKPKYNICQEPTKGGSPNLNRKLSKEWKENIGLKSSMYRHSPEIKELKNLQNKELSSIYEIYKNEIFLFKGSLIECANYLNVHQTSILNYYKQKYNSEYKVLKTKNQKKKIKLFIENIEIIFNSFGECDKYLKMWRGYTSTMVVRKENFLKDYKYKII